MTTKEIDHGTTGAKQQTWTTKQGARSLLARIVEENPTLDDESIFHAFSSECAAFFPEIVRYWVANNLKALRPRAAGDSVDRSTVEARVQARLLDFLLPNGKMLRDSTFGEVAKCSGWLSRVAKLGQPHEKVGDKLTEKEVKAALESGDA
jgi:hypothetical protein